MMDQMGKRIKEKRVSLGLQMKELSIRIGVTPSLISQIESGKAYPSIVTLKKVADALRTTVGELIGENEDLDHHPLLKSRDRRFVKENRAGTSLHLLSYHDPSKQIEPYIIQFNKIPLFCLDEKYNFMKIGKDYDYGDKFRYLNKAKINPKNEYIWHVTGFYKNREKIIKNIIKQC